MRPSPLAVTALLLLAALAFAPPTAAAPALAERVAALDRQAAQRLFPLATTALKVKHRDLGRRVLERAIALDPEHGSARRELGYVKRGGAWTRAEEPVGGVPEKDDAQAWERAARLETEALAVETWRAREILKLAAPAPPEEARPLLLALLGSVPRMPEVHAALGHPRVGERYVRPELVRLASEAPARSAAWRRLAEPALEAYGTEESLEVPDHGPCPWLKVGSRRVAGTFERGVVVFRARRTECAHELLRNLLGPEVKRWDPPAVCFLLPKAYEALIRAQSPDEATAERRLKSGTFAGRDAFLLRVGSIGIALDFYAHVAGFLTAERIASPRRPGPDGKDVVDDGAYAWFHEGLGYLLSLELWDSADSHFFSRTESHTKLASTLPKPELATRDTLLAWVGANVLAGRGLTLNDVLSRSLNALDFHASMEAWSFVRFLALYDLEAFRRLPAALAAQHEGAYLARADAAFTAVYGKCAAELEVLWRAWLLEVA
jgi:hypothetical protein